MNQATIPVRRYQIGDELNISIAGKMIRAPVVGIEWGGDNRSLGYRKEWCYRFAAGDGSWPLFAESQIMQWNPEHPRSGDRNGQS